MQFAVYCLKTLFYFEDFFLEEIQVIGYFP